MRCRVPTTSRYVPIGRNAFLTPLFSGSSAEYGRGPRNAAVIPTRVSSSRRRVTSTALCGFPQGARDRSSRAWGRAVHEFRTAPRSQMEFRLPMVFSYRSTVRPYPPYRRPRSFKRNTVDFETWSHRLKRPRPWRSTRCAARPARRHGSVDFTTTSFGTHMTWCAYANTFSTTRGNGPRIRTIRSTSAGRSPTRRGGAARRDRPL